MYFLFFISCFVANLHKIILILHQLDKKVEATAQIIS